MSSIALSHQNLFPRDLRCHALRKTMTNFGIEHWLAQRHTQLQIRNCLSGRGVRISKNTLCARIVAWKASRHFRTADSDPTLWAAIEGEFYTHSSRRPSHCRCYYRPGPSHNQKAS